MSNALNHRHPGQPGRLGMYFQTLMLSALGVGGVEATSVFYRAKWYPEAQAKFLCSWNPKVFQLFFSIRTQCPLPSSVPLSPDSLWTEQPSPVCASCNSLLLLYLKCCLSIKKGRVTSFFWGMEFYRVGFRWDWGHSGWCGCCQGWDPGCIKFNCSPETAQTMNEIIVKRKKKSNFWGTEVCRLKLN